MDESHGMAGDVAFEAVFNRSAHFLFLVDLGGVLIEANDTARAFVGLARDGVLGRSFLDTPWRGSTLAEQELFQEALRSAAEGRMKRFEVVLAHPDGSPAIFDFSLKPLDGELVLVEARDITELKQAQKRLKKLAHYDGLTSLPNRLFFQDFLDKAIRRNLRHGRLLAVMFVDLDLFKDVNDSLGHRAGDELLIIVARRLRECTRYEDFVARLSGDEFSIILTEIGAARDAEVAARRVVASLNRPLDLAGKTIRTSASLGIAVMPNDGGSADDLLDHADKAMYLAKERGRNTFATYAEVGDRDPLDETHHARPAARTGKEDPGGADMIGPWEPFSSSSSALTSP